MLFSFRFIFVSNLFLKSKACFILELNNVLNLRNVFGDSCLTD